ncbi:hypothetical protein LCGC14_1282610 [marine sediment metagenome]|uniref:Uncharacterized protein n=1 Tax=marine sediment metagenome TaxID=412755 RepID=A0A0F9NXV2_9ZZZZ
MANSKNTESPIEITAFRGDGRGVPEEEIYNGVVHTLVDLQDLAEAMRIERTEGYRGRVEVNGTSMRWCTFQRLAA